MTPTKAEDGDGMRKLKIYEIARDLDEAIGLRDAGFGYESKVEAEKAKRSPEIDPYYAKQLKVFELEISR